MGPTPFIFLHSTSSSMGSTALRHKEKGSQSTGRNFLPLNASPLTKRGSTPNGSLMHWATPPAMMPWRPAPWSMGIGGSQLSSAISMTSPPTSWKWRQNFRHSELTSMPCKQLRSSAVNTSLDPMHMKIMPSFNISKRAHTSRTAKKAGSHPSPTVLIMVQLDSRRRVMSQSGLPEGKRTARDMDWGCLTPKTGGAV